MRCWIIIILGFFPFWAEAQLAPQNQGEQGSVVQALKIMTKVENFLQQQGSDKLQKTLLKQPQIYQYADLFPIIFNQQGKIIAHGKNAYLVGRSGILVTDVTGKQFFLLGFKALQNEEEVAVIYQWINPLTQKIEDKTLYLRKYKSWIIGVSVQGKP